MSEETEIRSPRFKVLDRVGIIPSHKMQPESGELITGTIMQIMQNRRRGFIYQVVTDQLILITDRDAIIRTRNVPIRESDLRLL